VAIAVVLLIGAGLLTRSLSRLLDIDLGFNPSSVVIGRVALANARYPGADAWMDFFDRAVGHLAATPGVAAIGMNSAVPLEGGAAESPVMKEGDPPPSPDRPMQMCMFQTTGGDYFRAMGIPIRRGRAFDGRDGRNGPLVAIVDDSLVAKMFGGEDPIGKRIAFEAEGDHQKDMRPVWREVVGVVGTVRHYGLQSTRDFVQIYVPHTQLPLWSRERRPAMAIVAKTDGRADATAIVANIRHAIGELDPTLPVYGVQPLSHYVDSAVEQPRLASGLLVAFGALALLLAIVGIHGLLSYAVALRAREIGVRMALGASRRAIVGQVMRRGVLLTAIGLAVGLGLALAATRLLETQLYQVSRTDAATYVGVAALLTVVAAVASALPARRASGIDPLRALRSE
jgi:putative ABC transport system permease protein